MSRNRSLVAWIAVALVSVAAGLPAAAADYYVDPVRGNDANDGSKEAPWQRLRHAEQKLRAGDTLHLRGGTYRDDSIFARSAGTAAAPITVKRYEEEEAVITGTGIYDQIFHLNHDHWIIEGLRFEDTKGYNVLMIGGAEHVTVRNCRFRNQTGSMILIRGGGWHTIEGNRFDTTGSPKGGGDGDHIYIAGSHHNLVQSNHFVRAGHAACDQFEFDKEISHHNILRDNVVEQHWGGGFYVIRGSRRSLLENNRISFAGEEMEYPKAAFQLAACDNIVRRNLILRTGSRPYKHNGLGLLGYRYGGIDQHSIGNRVYHNVFYGVGRTAIDVSQRQACRVTSNRVLNNILYHCRTGGPEEPYWPHGHYYFTFETYHAFADNKWGEFPNDNFYHHNLVLHADPRGDHPGEDPIVFYEQDGWKGSLAAVQEKYPRHFHSNIERNPRLLDAERGDFRLAEDSPAIDAGDFLTRTTSAGHDTRHVPVADASFFCDGWERIEGDLIQVGDHPPARAVKVDYEANRITLDRPVSFAAGEPVSQPWTGAAPDLGAYESGLDGVNGRGPSRRADRSLE